MPQQLSIDIIGERLGKHTSVELLPNNFSRHAAVAVILREATNSEVDILFIRRAERNGDPWSGHMAFPGGHLEAEDASLKIAAIRETSEEIGIDLNAAKYLGPLDHQDVNPRGRKLNMLIAPHVFVLESAQIPTLNYEVAETVWTPLEPIFTGDNHTTENRRIAGQATPFGGYRIQGEHFVWGLTYRMLHSFCSVIDANWAPPA